MSQVTLIYLVSRLNFYSDLFMIDFESYLNDPDQGSLEWVEYKPDQSFPIARWGHACISHLNNIYIIGYNHRHQTGLIME